MKKTDIAMIIFIAAVSILVAYFVTDLIIGKAADEPVKVKAIDVVDAGIDEPDAKIFNADALNPAVEVTITPGEQ